MSEPYFGSPEEAASELGAPLLVAATAASALPRAGRRLSEYAVETILGAHLFHRLRLASPQIPDVIWVTGPHGTLEHIGWAVGIAEHAAATGRAAYLALLDGVQPLQGFATGGGLILPRSIVSRMNGFGIANAAGWVSDLQGVRLVFPTPVEPAGDLPAEPFRWILIVARALPEGIETTQKYRKAADGVVLAAAIRDHHREELLDASRALHGPGAPLLGIITMGPVTAGALPIIERWEHVLSLPDEPVPEPPAMEPPQIEPPGGEPTDSTGTPREPEAWEPPSIAESPGGRVLPAQKVETPAPPSAPPPGERPATPPRSSRRSARPNVVVGLGEGIRPREEPVPLVASWLPPEQRKRKGRRRAIWIAGAFVVVVAGVFLIRGEIVRRAGEPAAGPGIEPARGAGPAQESIPTDQGNEATPAPGFGDSSAAALAGVPAVTGPEPRFAKSDSIAGAHPAIAPPLIPSIRLDSIRARKREAGGVPGSEESLRSPILQGSQPPRSPEKEGARAPGETARADTAAALAGPAPGGQVASTAWPDTFFIHVSSYQQIAQAEEETKRLKGLGIDARVASVLLPARGIWYRVIVGAFPDSMAAWREASGLREIGYIAFAQVLRSGGRKVNH